MKNILAIVIFCFVSILVSAEEDNYLLMENVLFDRGYTKYDPHEYFYLRIYDDCYFEVFKKEWTVENLKSIGGYSRVVVDMHDGFEYNLVYVLDKKELPNILVIVYLTDNGKVYGYYKMNFSLEGTIIPMVGIGDLLVFY